MAAPLKIILAVTGIFVAGAVTGGVVSVRMVEHLARRKQAVERTGPTEIGARLTEQLGLTPDQKLKIWPIISQTSDELRKLRRETFNQTAGLIINMDEEISKELTDGQRVLLKEIRAKEEERRKKWMSERSERGKRNEPRAPGAGPVNEDGRKQAPPPPAP